MRSHLKPILWSQVPEYEASHLDAKTVTQCRKFHASQYFHIGPLADENPRAMPIISTDADELADYMRHLPQPEFAPVAAREALRIPDQRLPIAIRAGSCRRFSGSPVAKAILEKWLHESFSHTDARRPYASAGALYPVEILVWAEAPSRCGLEPGIHHYLPREHALEKLTDHAPSLDSVLGREGRRVMGNPAFALILVANLSRALFKYRSRGYRHALVEVGLMLRQSEQVAEALGLRSRIWSAFDDRRVIAEAGLNPTVFVSCMAQLFGISDPSAGSRKEGDAK